MILGLCCEANTEVPIFQEEIRAKIIAPEDFQDSNVDLRKLGF